MANVSVASRVFPVEFSVLYESDTPRRGVEDVDFLSVVGEGSKVYGGFLFGVDVGASDEGFCFLFFRFGLVIVVDSLTNVLVVFCVFPVEFSVLYESDTPIGGVEDVDFLSVVGEGSKVYGGFLFGVDVGVSDEGFCFLFLRLGLVIVVDSLANVSVASRVFPVEFSVLYESNTSIGGVEDVDFLSVAGEGSKVYGWFLFWGVDVAPDGEAFDGVDLVL